MPRHVRTRTTSATCASAKVRCDKPEDYIDHPVPSTSDPTNTSHGLDELSGSSERSLTGTPPPNATIAGFLPSASLGFPRLKPIPPWSAALGESSNPTDIRESPGRGGGGKPGSRFGDTRRTHAGARRVGVRLLPTNTGILIEECWPVTLRPSPAPKVVIPVGVDTHKVITFVEEWDAYSRSNRTPKTAPTLRCLSTQPAYASRPPSLSDPTRQLPREAAIGRDAVLEDIEFLKRQDKIRGQEIQDLRANHDKLRDDYTMLQIRHTSQASQLAKRTTDLVELQKSNKELKKDIVDAKADELGRA
ncbi:uncharacterized protein EHS24_009339 [Apiotrichum porosum]|uniref:Uncharacterized protein n=1 Tax=Apiotrichum porosum TaxID=105984 RepID=A0A427XLV5_9TREE|nr:uncharacterized protein EHS24_009339 [Apiotrichum porosum]RSH79687.1 hypothetical protein EHS24_009339 [Apiotrichum porosum]